MLAIETTTPNIKACTTNHKITLNYNNIKNSAYHCSKAEI